MDLKAQIEQFFTDLKGVLQIITPVIAFIGVVGLGIMYLGSGWPIISKFRRDNPDMANNVALGLVFCIAAGTLSSLIVFS